MKKIFTHYWVTGFGWENTIFIDGDFENLEILGNNEKDGTIFLAKNKLGKNHILKGKIEK